jgi:HEAT repeat protein
MNLPEGKEAPPESGPRGRRDKLPLDTKQIAEAVMELNILRKNVQVYPLGHDQVQRSLGRAYQALLKTLAVHSSLALGVAKNTLMLGDELLDPDSAVFRELTVALQRHDVAELTFQKGVREEELLRFLGIIAKRPEDVAAAGGVSAEFSAAALEHIAVRLMDYSQFHLTDRLETPREGGVKDRKAEADRIWHDYISHFTSGTLSQSDEDINIDDLERLSPAQLAGALNSGRMESTVALNTYERIVSRHLRYTSSRKESAEGDHGNFSNLNLLLEELSPELRRQFLSATFNQCTPQRNIPEAEGLLRGLSRNFVVDMLRQASAEGKEISPSLLNLVQKIGHIGGIDPGKGISQPAWKPAAASRQKLQHLFKREDHETFIVPEYDELLSKISVAPQDDSDSTFPIEAYLESISSPQLDIQIARVVIAFLEMDIGSDEYNDYADQLLAAVPPLLTAGLFGILLAIFETFSRHSKEKNASGVRAAADAALKRLRAPELVVKAVRIFDRRQADKEKDARAFLVALGPAVVPESVKLLANRETVTESDPLLRVLGHFRGETISEAARRLDDTRLHVVINMLLLLQALDARETSESLLPFLTYPDAVLRMQALKTFLAFENPEAIPHLRQAVRSRRSAIFFQAVEWAGQYRIRAVVPDLLSKIRKYALFKSDLLANEAVISALGRIGDPEAIAPLEKMVAGTFTLNRARLLRLKRALYTSLAGYPYTAIVSLIKAGYRSRDKVIRRISQDLRSKSETTADASSARSL